MEPKLTANMISRIRMHYTGYPETTNATDNNKRSWNQQAGKRCKYLSGNNLPRIKLIRGKLFTPYDCLLVSVALVVLCRVGCLWVTGVCMAKITMLSIDLHTHSLAYKTIDLKETLF